jgi:hypothetical protein
MALSIPGVTRSTEASFGARKPGLATLVRLHRSIVLQTYFEIPLD